MSTYTTPTGNYPPPHGPPHPPHPGIQLSAHSPDSAQNVLSAHHSLHVAQPYQYDSQPSQQSPYNNGPNPATHTNTDADNIQYQAAQYQGQPVPAPAAGDAQKANRLRKACDSCSVRKVKCDETGPPCRACVALEIPCTFERPSRRRGPPNKHAEAMKKRKVETPTEMPTSPNNVAATLASLSHAVLNAESICPLPILELLVDDFFTYIHPLAPFPHEPSFRAAFSSREDLKNPSFLSLLASMVGALVASFPRRPRLHLKAQHRELLFPSSMSLVERCHKVAVEARGAGYLDKDLSIYDAVTSYFLGLAASYTFQYRQCRLYFGEALNIARSTGAHKIRESGSSSAVNQSAPFGGGGDGYETQAEPVDYIQQEISRRVFWIILIGIRSLQQLGASAIDLVIPPPTRNEPYPPPPLEVDDDYIYVNHVDPQPEGLVSKLTGFNLGIRIYGSLTPMVTMDMAYSIDGLFDWNRQKEVLESCLRDVKHVLEDMPQELLLTPNSEAGQFKTPDQPFFSPMADYPGLRSNGNELGSWSQESPEVRRRLQYEIQKANIYVSQLGTRSYIVEHYCSLQETYEQSASRGSLNSPNMIDPGFEGSLTGSGNTINVADEREAIVRDLLRVLGSVSQVNMEPNGYSLVNKIRQIASTLLDSPQNRKGPLALKSEEYLGQFLDVLMKLERASPSLQMDSGDMRDVEEEELRNWADLREYQLRFLNSGGFLNGA